MPNLKTLAFEIGTEEIPAFDLKHATAELGGLMSQALEARQIPFGEIKVYSSPRRLIAIVSDVATETEAVDEVFRGPSATIAFDEAGQPTKAALGFARGKGVEVDTLELREEDGVSYVFASRHISAQQVSELLPEALGEVITSISWPKSCRWGRTRALFSRPVRWLVALLGDDVIPVKFADLVASRETYGHRVLSYGPHEVSSADQLVPVVEASFVVPSEQSREHIIRAGVERIEKETGLQASLPPKTLTEVVNLTEYPTVLVGEFDDDFLQVPEEIIVDAMLMHQRYFPLYDKDHRLTNQFIIVSNGDPACGDLITEGNERVVAARLYDARFFYQEDLKQPLEAYLERLDEVVFQESLGTMRAKTERVVALATSLAEMASLAADEKEDIVRAAMLAKADLVTNAVIEFTSVQGIMGSYYAAASGENSRVAQAIADHYRPRFSGDDLPESQVGRFVALADKLDTICGLFAVGQGPTGSSDPFALRRSAIGIIAMLEAGLPVKLSDAIDLSLNTFESSGVDFDLPQVSDQVMDFFITRTKVLLRDGGVLPDSIDAVLAAGVKEPAVIGARSRALDEARKNDPETFADLATAFARANNLRQEEMGLDVDTALFSAAESELSEAIDDADRRLNEALASDNYPKALQVLAGLRQPIDQFFLDVMVMDEDQALRRNRLSLLNRFVQVFAAVADFGLMAKK